MEQESETHNPLPRLSIGDGRVSKRKSELMGIVDSSEDTVSDYSIFPATKDVESLELKSGKEKEVDRATSSRATSAGRFQTELNVILSFHNVWYDSSYGIAALQEQDVKAKPVDVIEELRRRLDDMDPRGRQEVLDFNFGYGGEKSEGRSALHVFVEYEKHDLIDLFLEYKANPNVQTTAIDSIVSGPVVFNETPLHLSCHSGLDSIVKKLLDAGADPNATNSKGQCPVELLLERDRIVHFECDVVNRCLSLLFGSNRFEERELPMPLVKRLLDRQRNFGLHNGTMLAVGHCSFKTIKVV